MAEAKRFPCRLQDTGRFLGYLLAEDEGGSAVVVLPRSVPDPPFEKELVNAADGPLTFPVRSWLEGSEEVRTVIVPDEPTARRLARLLEF